MSADAAIKELLATETQTLRDEVSKQEQRCEELAKALQDLSAKIVERERDAEKMKESLDKCREDLETSNKGSQAQLTEDCTAMKTRLDKFEDDVDGIGGLKQAHEKVANLERALTDLQPKLDEDMRLVKENTTRTEAFDRKMLELSRQVEDAMQAMKVSEERLTSVEGVNATVSAAQEALEDSVTRKYEKLWEDVLHAIEELKGGETSVMEKYMTDQKEAAKIETRSLVNYALNFMASAHGERRQNAMNRSLILAWKEQTWNSSRRRLGIAYLNKIFQRRKLVVFDSWNRKDTANALCKRLHGQYEGQLGAVYTKIQDEAGSLKRHCSQLDGSVSKLEQEKSSKQSLEASVQDIRGVIDELKMKTIAPIKSTLQDHHQVHERHEGLHRGHSDQEAQLWEKMSNNTQEVSDINLRCVSYAKVDDVDNMVRDVLMIWNSIKQLDTSKADKKDVDGFALETGNRDKLSSRRLEDLESDLGLRTKQDTLRLQEKWTEIDGRLDESGRQFRHWEQMWEKLSGFVEDLVAKIGDMQGGDGKLPSATLRSAGARANSRSRPEMPTMPAVGGYDHSHSLTVPRGGNSMQSTAAESFDSKNLWINSAKGIVDATIDQAVTTPVRRAPRPKSASGPRKPHDRAR